MDMEVIIHKVILANNLKAKIIMEFQHILHMSQDMLIKVQQEEITMEILHIIIDIIYLIFFIKLLYKNLNKSIIIILLKKQIFKYC